MKELVDQLIEVGLLHRDQIGFSNGRLAYDDIVARACVAVEMGSLRRHINNTVVERYYRDQAFSNSTIAGVRAAGEVLRDQIGHSETRIKFNKGTLQTWLVYCFWAPTVTGPLPSGLLSQFEFERARLKRGDINDVEPETRRLLELVSLYDDRASYRVTDVSSVLARDVIVHLFSQAFFDTRSHRRSDELLAELRSSRATSTQALVFEYVEAVGWGDPLFETLDV